MKRYNFNKLIRSNLPERMKKEGVYLSGRSLTDEEFAKELKNKLVEEAGEVQDTQSREDLIKELADVMEVIETLTSLRGITKEEIESVNFSYADLQKMMKKYDLEKLKDGFNTMPDGEEIFYISNPASSTPGSTFSYSWGFTILFCFTGRKKALRVWKYAPANGGTCSWQVAGLDLECSPRGRWPISLWY